MRVTVRPSALLRSIRSQVRPTIRSSCSRSAARGIDLRRVKADRARKSVGTERTFDHDISSGAALREQLERIVGLTWDRIERSR
ncbi:MAG: hypothetical protein ACK44O_12760, partial [Novosphingobium sp.]